MHCDFYDGGVKTVTLLYTSCTLYLCVCVCVCAAAAVSLSTERMEEGMLGDDIIS